MSEFLNEMDARNFLEKYGVPMVKSAVGHSENEAETIAISMNFPVVMKVLSSQILHKTEAGCVFLNVKDAAQVKQVYRTILENAAAYNPDAVVDGVLIQEMAPSGLEVMVGMKHDPQFGPVIVAGTGGIYVEIFKDVSLRLLPITRRDARAMIEETKLVQILRGARGTVYDEEALIQVLLRLSELALANPSVQEVDINPLFLYPKGQGACGVDALIRLER